MKSKYDEAEDLIKEILNPLLDTPAWEVLLDMLNRRYMVKVLVDRRKELGLTQKELAERLDLSQSSISEFENNPWPDIQLSTYRRYCHALELTYTWDLVEIPSEPEKGAE